MLVHEAAAPRTLTITSWGPAIGCTGTALAALLLGVPVVGLVAALGVVATAPIATTLSTRVMLWSTAALAATGLSSALPGVPTSRTWVAVLLVTGLLVAAAVAAHGPTLPWRPRVTGADRVLLGSSALLLVTLLAPYLGAGSEGILLDLARGRDNQSHFAMVHALLSQGGAQWSTADGSPPLWAGQYPLGVHTLAAHVLLLLGWSDAVPGFAVATALGASLAALLLAWVGVDVARRTSPRLRADPAATAAAVIGGCALVLGGLVTGLFEVGHTAYLVPLAVVVGACWVGLNAASARHGAGVLVVAALAAAWSYQPLVAAVLPPMLLVASRHLGARARGWVAAGLGAALVVATTQLLRWRDSLAVVARATGEYSTPVRTSLLMVVVTVVLVVAAAQRGRARPAGRALCTSAGLGLAAAAFAVLARSAGMPVEENYYVAKALQGVWVSVLPIVVGLAGWATVAVADRAPGPPALRRGIGLGLALALGLAVAVLPDGRYPGALGGPALLTRRLVERDRSAAEVQVLAAARASGPAAGDVAVLLGPGGWFDPVAHDDATWIRDGRSASEWLNSLRAVPSTASQQAARCTGRRADAAALPCLRRWQQENPGTGLVVVLGAATDPTLAGLVREELPGARVVALTVPR